jgi:hypothetical protein
MSKPVAVFLRDHLYLNDALIKHLVHLFRSCFNARAKVQSKGNLNRGPSPDSEPFDSSSFSFRCKCLESIRNFVQKAYRTKAATNQVSGTEVGLFLHDVHVSYFSLAFFD